MPRHVAAATCLAMLVTGGAAAAGCSGGDAGAGTGGSTTTAEPQEAPGTTEVPPERGTQLDAYLPTIGDCFDRRKATNGSGRGYILKLDCALPHSFEVFAIVDIPEPGYPGEAAIESLAKRQCPRSWTDYVGEPYETSALELSYEAPSRGNWSLTLKHSLACLIKSSSDKVKLEGSKRGSGE